MGRWISNFDTTAEFETFSATTGYSEPHVTLTKDTGKVMFKEFIETRVVAKFNVTDTSSPTPIGYNNYISGFSEIEIDGVVQQSVVSAYTFDTLGEHTVKYTLTDPTSIGDSAFRNCSSLTSIDIPSGVTSIGSYAFNNTPWWTSYSADTSHHYGNVIYINDIAYKATATGITSAELKDGTIGIGSYAFNGCRSLTSIVIPDSVTSIGLGAFGGCSSLTSIVIPNGVTTIGYGAFQNCSSLTSCTIGSGVTSIGTQAFYDCSSLTSITVDNNNTIYDSRNNCNAIIETSTNTLIVGCNNTVIPNGVTSIGIGAFYDCSSLSSITIPDSVTSIGQNAFRNCSSLKNITSNATTAPTISNYTFYSVKTGGILTVPSGSTGYNVWMGTGNYYLGKYNWTKVEQ